MAGFAEMRTLDRRLRYARLSEDELLAAVRPQGRSAKGGRKGKRGDKALEKAATKNARKARTRDSMQALSKLAELVDGRYRIVSQPPYGRHPDARPMLRRVGRTR